MSSSEDGQPQTEAELEELFAELQLREVRYFHLSEQAEQIEESTTDTAERNAAWRDASAAWLWVESGIAKYGRLSDRDEGRGLEDPVGRTRLRRRDLGSPLATLGSRSHGLVVSEFP